MGLTGPFGYAAVYAKVHSRLGRLLTEQDWSNLLSASDLSRLLRTLEGTPYDATLEGTEESSASGEVDLARLERDWRGRLAHEFRKPLRYVPNRVRDLLTWRWRIFELDNVKTVLGAVHHGVRPQEAQKMLVPLGNASTLPWERLLKANSVPGVVKLLSGTFYGETMQPALGGYSDDRDLLSLEVRLDLAYFRRLLRMVKDLGGRDGKEARRFLGTMIDSQNVLWAFRYRIYYRLSPEEILVYALHDGIQIDAGTVRRIATGARVIDILSEVWDGRLRGVSHLERASDREALSSAERLFNRYFLDEARQVQRSYALHLGCVLGFQVQLESELRDLISVAEGKASGLSADDIRPYLTTGGTLGS